MGQAAERLGHSIEQIQLKQVTYRFDSFSDVVCIFLVINTVHHQCSRHSFHSAGGKKKRELCLNVMQELLCWLH